MEALKYFSRGKSKQELLVMEALKYFSRGRSKQELLVMEALFIADRKHEDGRDGVLNIL